MAHPLPLTHRSDPDIASYAMELRESTLRRIIIVIGLAYLAWHLVAVAWPDTFGLDALWHVLVIAPVAAATCGVSLWLLRRVPLAAHVSWQLGLGGAICVALIRFGQPELVFLLAVLPLMSVLAAGSVFSLLSEGLVVVLVLVLSHTEAMPVVPAGYALATVLAGALMWLLGWVASDALLSALAWSTANYEQARAKMEEARDQQLELRQTQDDLIQATRELARLSDRLKVLNQVAEEARKTKEEFVANVSHELRTPLNMIIGFSEMITQAPRVYGDRLPAALLADIAAIQRNSQHLAKLVDDVLDLSQVDAGRMALTKEWSSLDDILRAAGSVVQPLFESKELSLCFEIEPGLPLVWCDSTRIRQVVINLLSNAGRFTEEGGVTACAERAGDRVCVSVADTGPGIAEEDQKRLFEPFQQLDGSIRRLHGGTGLGLSISRRFVEMHGGSMWMDSTVGVGTRIFFTIPISPSDVVTPEPQGARRWFSPYHHYEPRERASRAPAPQPIPRFILLEQDGDLARLFTRYMDQVEVVSVRDAAGALAELSRSPALALISNGPPSGEDPLARVGQLPYGTPIMRCWVPGRDEAARRLGVEQYLVKPVTRDALLSAVEQLDSDVETILLVDDEPEVLQLFTRMFRSAGRTYRVLRAKDGLQALELLRRRRPDAMLLDLVMPGMDGLQVLWEKSQDPAIQAIPTVVVSSRDPAGDAIVGDMLSVTHSGGFSVPALLECVRALGQILAPFSQPES